jgi:argininosuccinate lyase
MPARGVPRSGALTILFRARSAFKLLQIDDVFGVLTLEGSLNARNVLGGTAPAQVRAQVALHRTRLG